MGLTRDEVRQKLRELPRRAVVVFALRCAKRVEPFLKLSQVLPDAYSAGIDTSAVRWYGRSAAAAAAAAAYADADADAYADAAYADAAYADAAADAAADADLEKLLALNLGKPGELGEPIRWNDPRLGPLWPAGEPAWYVEAQKSCRELEEKLRALPAPNAAPIGPVLAARLDNQDRVTRMWAAGKLAKYKGEYVISDGETVFAHGKNLVKVWEKAEKKVRAAGKPMDSFTEFYVL